MKKIYKPLTADQKSRGVIFSSTLSRATVEQPDDTVHEVFESDSDKYRTSLTEIHVAGNTTSSDSDIPTESTLYRFVIYRV